MTHDSSSETFSGRRPSDGCVRGEKLHTAVAEFRVRVPHAARQLHELSNVADEKRAVKAQFPA